MEFIVCGKRDARAVLVLYKYCPYFRNFVGIGCGEQKIYILAKGYVFAKVEKREALHSL